MLRIARSSLARIGHSYISATSLATSAAKQGSYKIQNDQDFVERVENSKDTVIVDFHAS